MLVNFIVKPVLGQIKRDGHQREQASREAFQRLVILRDRASKLWGIGRQNWGRHAGCRVVRAHREALLQVGWRATLSPVLLVKPALQHLTQESCVTVWVLFLVLRRVLCLLLSGAVEEFPSCFPHGAGHLVRHAVIHNCEEANVLTGLADLRGNLLLAARCPIESLLQRNDWDDGV